MKGPIDLLDAEIIPQLQVDSGLANTEVARRLGVAETTVRNRVDRMLSHKVLLACRSERLPSQRQYATAPE
jgi:Lrp/AsnC family transcriptional regulator for asnA, asnC and gidA